jgi:predicted patatin/cPLA2 family phospholipase
MSSQSLSFSKICYNHVNKISIQNMPNKLAIIMSGGGMSCSYGAGVTTALIEKFNIINPDIVIARSGSAGTGSYFISKQYDSIKNI